MHGQLVSDSAQTAQKPRVSCGGGRPRAHFGTLWINEGSNNVNSEEFGIAMSENLGRRVIKVALELAGTGR